MSTLPDEPEHHPSSAPEAVVADPGRRPFGRTRPARAVAGLVRAARAVADADPAAIEESALQLGESRRYLAPVAWAAGALVLLVRGVKLLILNWRLTLVELVPAAWVWLVMWDLKQHTLRGEAFRQLTVGGLLLMAAVSVAASIASFWCNTVFAFAISERPPRIAPAARQAKPHRPRILRAGTLMGITLVIGATAIPRIDSAWLYLSAIGALYAVMLISFVAVPARILGVRKQRLPPKQALGRWTVAMALSAVAMTPGFVLDRLGLILLGVPHLHLVGLVLLSTGTALYAAGLSSVRAVKLSMKLDAPR